MKRTWQLIFLGKVKTLMDGAGAGPNNADNTMFSYRSIQRAICEECESRPFLITKVLASLPHVIRRYRIYFDG